MKLKIMSVEGKETGDVEMPVQFQEPIRLDLIKKAVLAIQSNKRQPYGSFPKAGMRHSADLSRRRRKYRGSYGHGISRVPRKILSRRGTQMHWVGAIISSTVGGRRAHPPKAHKVWNWKLNVKERRKAICSALSATMLKNLVKARGHMIPDNYPFIVENKLETFTKTKEVSTTLKNLGFTNELLRASKTKIRSGKGKLRGRKRVVKKSVLFVVSEAEKLGKAASNLPGVQIVNVRKINSEALAPGGHPGRATLFTKKAIDIMNAEKLFTKDFKGISEKKTNVKEEKKAKPKKEKSPIEVKK